ncbi:hypothetical protein ACIBAC_41980 [Streptomyces sp. NPDC051362]|uniref:hypothetical protein n=1 Tax=Streptomyces sp. NPDC051362 TaxID=3365651 RepID=UPI003790A6CB
MTSQSAATLRSRYVEQAASDLKENRRRQQELSEQITVLKQEETLLADILTLAEQYEGLSDLSRLPEQAHDEPVIDSTKPIPELASTPGGESARGSASPASPLTNEEKPSAKSLRPLLGQVLLELLDAHPEPRLAKELRDELLGKYPDRNPTPQVVRNTLESLVAKGRVQRHKQQRSVMYTVGGPAARASEGTSAEPG